MGLRFRSRYHTRAVRGSGRGAAAGKVAKIGFLAAGSVSGTSEKFFGRDLRALGYVEGKHIAVENRSAQNKLDRLPVLAS
jgi:putative tryptophan/tyrosine transport system substrate-binding protein